MPSIIKQKGPSRGTLTAFVLVLCLGMAAAAQVPQGATSSSGDSGTPPAPVPKPEKSGQDSAQTAKADAKTTTSMTQTSEKNPAKDTPHTPEEPRRAQLVVDTNRLYQMAQDLQAEVAKSNKDTLSLTTVKKADELEKLARSLKERMREQ